MSGMFSLPKMERGQCWAWKEQYNKWHTPLWTQSRASAGHKRWFPKAVCPHISLVTSADNFQNEKKKKEESNHPSWGCADSDRQLSQGGFGENTLWNEMSSPVVCCPGAVKLKLKKLRVAKRLSHCSGKNFLNWRPQASSAETVSIQDWVIFSAISSFRAKWSTACSPHLHSQHRQRGQFWGKAKAKKG